MEEILNRLHTQITNQMPFAVYAKPFTHTITAIFQRNNSKNKLHNYTESGFLFAPFNAGITAFIPFLEAEVTQIEYTPKNPDFSVTSETPINNTAKKNFEDLVTRCISEIKKGNFDKLVASRTEFVAVNNNIADVYCNLLYTYPNAFRYCFYHPDTGLWMGATPEQLINVNHNTIKTVALAGTQLYNAQKEAVWEVKEQQEQQFVTDYIIAELKDITHNISATEPYTFRAGNIVHIKTDVTASLLKETNLETVINTLHPTPAVCGLPKLKAKDFLINNEGYNREYYSGFLGEINREGKSDLFVNLRSMKIKDNTAQLYIGCGITKDSNPEKEFYETVNKSITMRRVL